MERNAIAAKCKHLNSTAIFMFAFVILSTFAVRIATTAEKIQNWVFLNDPLIMILLDTFTSIGAGTAQVHLIELYTHLRRENKPTLLYINMIYKKPQEVLVTHMHSLNATATSVTGVLNPIQGSKSVISDQPGQCDHYLGIK
uniref:Uncharacterized protein n=1 Tax=Glossina pallidipes TaxID=7398 RepID=A0A1B0AB38_GLOPL